MKNTQALNKERKFILEVKRLAAKYNLSVFVVTDGASGYSNLNNSKAVKNSRTAHEEWERKNGIDPDHDWLKQESLKFLL